MKKCDDVKVSVVIPTTGRSTLKAAVHSVVEQTVKCNVIVVLDDPSQSATVHKMLAEYPCEILATPGRYGGAYARNMGADHATTQYIAFLDDDDWWERDKVETQCEAIDARSLNQNSQVFCATAMVFHRGSDSVVIPEIPLVDPTQAADYLVQRPRLRYGTYAVQTSSLLVSKALFSAVRWNDALPKHQDWDFVARCLAQPDTEFVWVDHPLVHVVQGTANSVSKMSDWRASLTFLEMHESTLSPRAHADFTFTQILRSSIAAKDWQGIGYAIRQVRRGVPHPAALVVGLSGILSLLKGQRS